MWLGQKRSIELGEKYRMINVTWFQIYRTSEYINPIKSKWRALPKSTTQSWMVQRKKQISLMETCEYIFLFFWCPPFLLDLLFKCFLQLVSIENIHELPLERVFSEFHMHTIYWFFITLLAHSEIYTSRFSTIYFACCTEYM